MPSEDRSAWTRVFLGLGSNLGDRAGNIGGAVAWMESHELMELRRMTGLLETEPWGPVSQPAYLNAVVEVGTDLSAMELLSEAKRTERRLGRAPGGARWGPREIDIDILIYGDVVLERAELIVPHPRLHERDFVIRQLLELDPGLIHPRLCVPLSCFLE